MKKMLEQGEDMRDMLHRLNKKGNCRLAALLVICSLILAGIVTLIVVKFCSKKRRYHDDMDFYDDEDDYFEDEEEEELESEDCGCGEKKCDENGCSFTSDDDFEK